MVSNVRIDGRHGARAVGRRPWKSRRGLPGGLVFSGLRRPALAAWMLGGIVVA